jgi:hypothetical protein
MFMIPHCRGNRLADGGEFVSLKRQPRLSPIQTKDLLALILLEAG